MGYSIRVVSARTKKEVDVSYLKERGIVEFGITFNYAKWYYGIWPGKTPDKKDEATPFGQMFAGNDRGLRSLYGLPMEKVILKLKEGINRLHGLGCSDYFKPTEGNARAALLELLAICECAERDHPRMKLTIQGD